MKNIEEAKKDRWGLFFILSTAYIAVFANIQGFMGLIPMVQEEFLLSRVEVGLYTSFYFLSATLVAIIAGRIVDRLGTKKGLIIGVGMIGIMMILHAVSPFYTIILGLAFFTGFAFSVITPSVNKGVVELAKPSRKSFFMGIVHSGGGLGGFLGASILPFVGEILGWRTALIFGSIFAILVAAIIFKFYRPKIVPDGAGESFEDQPTLKQDLIFLLKNRYLVWVCFMGVVFGMSTSAVGGHFPLYLTQDLGFSPAFAGLGLGVFHIGGVIGQPVMGLLNEKLLHNDSRKSLFILGLFISGFAFFLGLVVSNFYFPPYAIIIFSFLMGFFTMGIIAIYFTAVTGLVSARHIGIATGIALIFIRISVVLTPALFGLVADISSEYAESWIILGAASLLFTASFFYFSRKYISQSNLG